MGDCSKRPLGDIMTLHRGFDLPSSLRDEGCYPVISSSGISGYHSDYKTDGASVVTGRYGTIGKVTYHDGPCWPLNTTLFVSDFQGNHPRYVAYLLEAVLAAMPIDGTDKSTVPGVDRNVLHSMKVPFISQDDQMRSIAILSAIDDKIANNKKLMTELEETARLIYDYWFTQFDFPDENGNPYRSSGGKMVYNETLHREIPTDWEVMLLGDYQTSVGGTPSRAVDDYWGGNIAWLKTEEIQDTVIAPCKEYITEKGLQGSNAKVLPSGSIIVAMYGKGTAGRVGYLPFTATTNQACWAISPDNEDLSAFLYLYVKAANNLINQVITGSIQQNLNKGALDGLAFALPPDKLLKESGLASTMRHLCSLSEESIELEKLRNWLLPMLMNGQVTVEMSGKKG